jgi:twinfilin-like protein
MEQELSDLRAAERDAGDGYDGSRSKRNHLGTHVGMNWSTEVEDAVKSLGAGDQSHLVVIVSFFCGRTSSMRLNIEQGIDTPSETLCLISATDTSVEKLGSTIPSSVPCA